jgi:hypothetical protein
VTVKGTDFGLLAGDCLQAITDFFDQLPADAGGSR